jgi:hypothetical protein
MKTNTLLASGILMLLLSVFIAIAACKEELVELHEMRVSTRQVDPILQVQFDQEVITYYRTPQELTHSLDLISTAPTIEAQSLDLSLDQDGELTLLLEKIPTSRSIYQPPKPSPDPDVEWHRIEMSQGVLKGYDVNNALLFQDDAALPNMSDLVDSLNAQSSGPINALINETIGCTQIVQGQFSFTELIDYLARIGGIFTVFDPGFTTVRIPAELAGVVGSTDDIVFLLDTANELIAGFVLYNEQGEALTSVLYTYTTTPPYFIEQMQTSTFVDLPSGQNVEMVTEVNISNLQFQININ